MTRNQPRRKLRGWTGALPALLLIGVGGALCAAPGARAQTAAENAGEEMILFESIPSVFGASKYEQSAAEAPASVTVITAEDIQRFGFRTLGAILHSVRGFYTTYDRNYT